MKSPSAMVILFLLMLTMFLEHAHGIQAREIKTETRNMDNSSDVLRIPSMDLTMNKKNETDVADNDHHHHHSHGPHGLSHMDPSTMVFFTLRDLKLGKKIPVYFPRKDLSTFPKFLPREKADSIPFSLKHLPFLLKLFSIPLDSPKAKDMEETLTMCEFVKPIKGETSFCATSLESMLDFALSIFGSNSQFKFLTTKHQTVSSTLFQNYTVSEIPRDIAVPKMVACHTFTYPYAVYYCHSQESENKVFEVSLVGDNGDRVDAIAVCHMDTSEWNPSQVSFRVLGFKPGESHVCHFFPAHHLVMVPIN